MERRGDDVGPDEVRQDAGDQAGDRAGQDADQDRPDRVHVDRDLEDGRDGLAEHDVDGHRDRDQDDRACVEPAPTDGHVAPPCLIAATQALGRVPWSLA